MQTIKPSQLVLLQQVVDYRGQFHNVVAMMLGFSLSNPETLLTEQALVKATNTLLKGMSLDEGLPKTRGELMVYGSFKAPEKPAQQGVVTVGTHNMRKDLIIFPKRHWEISSPHKGGSEEMVIVTDEPLVDVPLDYQHAFGGKGFLPNQQGIGYLPDVNRNQLKDPKTPIPLPQVELRNALLKTPFKNEHQPVASFLPLPLHHPGRQAFYGKIDAEYMKHHFPALPNDTNPAFFQMAPLDQQIEGFFVPDETVQINGMSSSGKLITQLPPYRARCFIHGTQPMLGEFHESFREIPSNLDSVILFPNDDLGVVVHRAIFPVSGIQAEEVHQYLLAIDHADPQQQQPVSHYQQALHHRLGKDRVLYTLKEDDLLPTLEVGNVKNPAADGFPSPLVGLSELDTLNPTETLANSKQALQALEPSAAGLPAMPALPAMAALSTATQSLQLATQGIKIPGFNTIVPKDQAASQQVLKTLLSGKGNSKTYSGVVWSKLSFAGKDLSNADFSGADLKDIDFTGATLNGASFAQATLTNVNFTSAKMDQCNFRHATLNHCQFDQTQLTAPITDESTWINNQFTNQELTNIVFIKTQFSGNQFTQSKLKQITWVAGEGMDNTTFTQCLLDHCDCTQQTLKECTFSNSQLVKCQFINSHFDGCTFDNIQAQTVAISGDKAVVSNSQLNNAQFKDCSFTELRWYKTEFTQCDFAGNVMLDSVFDWCAIDKTDFQSGQLANSRWLSTQITNSNFFAANLTASRWCHCRLKDNYLKQIATAYLKKEDTVGLELR